MKPARDPNSLTSFSVIIVDCIHIVEVLLLKKTVPEKKKNSDPKILNLQYHCTFFHLGGFVKHWWM